MSHATSPPSIRIYDSGPSLHSRYALPRRSPPSYAAPSAIPMAIPNARESPPPPLPPPRYINELNDGQDPGWQWANSAHNGTYSRQSYPHIKEGSSLLGFSIGKSLPVRSDSDTSEDRSDHASSSRRDNSHSPPKKIQDDLASEQSDKELGPIRPTLPDHRLQSEKQLGQKSLQNSSHAYDKQLLSKIGGPNTPTRTQPPGFHPSSAQESSNPPTAFSSAKGPRKPLSMPERLYTSLDSPAARWPTSGTISPGHSGFRSPVFDSASSDSMPSRMFGTSSATEETASATRSHRGSYEQGIFMDHDFAMDENGIRDLNINDRSPGIDDYQLKGGLKRRASSPPSEAAREDRPTGAGNTDLYHRRSQQMLVNRNSPVSRFHANQGSLSSASSLSQRAGSYASSYGISIASSATSFSDRLSPGALSPSTETELGPISPYVAANRSGTHNPSPRGSMSRMPLQRGPTENEPPHNRKLSSDSLIHSRHSSVSKMSGLYICECCPKKPKKFESEEELRTHELEKQYTCAFCPNRFKNKNEAERHQNSLHLRRHSWSCAALEGPHAAFHPSTARPGAADVCGYCGKEFANPPNWEERNDHLNHTHKFGECNQAKKFFRADHFRQHLKHSHAGSSGKWTNMLENACMKDEPPPSTSGRLQSRNSHSSAFDGTGAGSNSGGVGAGLNSAVINEVHDES